MPTFTVHQPPPRLGEAASAPERFVFVRDGFHFWAFVLTPFWLLRYRLWLAFVIYLAVSILLGIALRLSGAGATFCNSSPGRWSRCWSASRRRRSGARN